MITVCFLYLSCGLILASGEVEAAAAAAAPVVIQVWLCWVFDWICTGFVAHDWGLNLHT